MLFHLPRSPGQKTKTDISDMHSHRKCYHMRVKHAKETSHYCSGYAVIVLFGISRFGKAVPVPFIN